ncbi:MAG: class I SAM-dependent methyltransferase [Rhodobacteraceae bacterium]|nr:class I SAM-dependent methyltransferase [Paracoccaceae bacterium]
MTAAALRSVHEKLVFSRRVDVLARTLGDLVPPGSAILDVGTGDGQIAARIGAMQPGTTVQGIDVLLRPRTHIPVTLFDGATIPLPDKSVDVVSFVDVLHHTDDPDRLLAEASRVARTCVILKDHLAENGVNRLTLRVMDWVGNAPHGVVLPYNYASRQQWDDWFAAAGLRVDRFSTDVPLYPAPFSAVFGRKLHFVARLTPLV